jgi:hypothetical protein
MKRHRIDLTRRHALRISVAGLFGLVGSSVVPTLVGVREASAAVITPDAIKPRIPRSGLAVQMVELSKPPATSAVRPDAALNDLSHARLSAGT